MVGGRDAGEAAPKDAPRGGLPAPAVVVCLAAAFLPNAVTWLSEPSEVEPQEVVVPSYTLSELQHFTSEEDEGEGADLLLAVWGRVFNVTDGAEFYGINGSYKKFAGHDCTRAFALYSTKAKLLDMGLEDLPDEKIVSLNDTYWTVYLEKYPIVGRLEDPPYEPELYDQYAGPYAEVKPAPSLAEQRAGANATRRARPAGARRVSKCPMSYVAKAAKDLVQGLIPRMLLGQ